MRPGCPPSRRLRLIVVVVLALALLSSLGCKRRREALIDDNELLFARAQAALSERHFQDATKKLGDIGLVSAIEPELDPEIKLALADTYFYQYGIINAVEAQSRYEQFLSFYPLHEQATYARYQVGVCLFMQSENPENDQEYTLRALEHFDGMLRDLEPGDAWYLAAQGMRIKAFNKLAAHEWAVARFYLKKERYPGAIRRLNTLVDRYPGAQVRPDALVELVRSHLAVGDPESARLALARLRADYPSRSQSEDIEELAARIEGAPTGETAEASSP